MLAAERKKKILDKLQTDKKVVVAQLSQEFDVSEETIRRDLDKLEKEGLAIKSYGGATLNESNADVPFTFRKKKNMDGKSKIARLLENEIKDGDHIFLDASTTALAIVDAIKYKEGLTVITNSVEVLLAQPEVSSWEVIATGGYFKEESLAMVGPVAMKTISGFYVDKAILSCKGIDLEKGITDANELFAQVKQTMLKAARYKILAVDYTKFNVIGFAKICDIFDIDLVVTDRRPSEEWLKFFEEKGVPCVYEE